MTTLHPRQRSRILALNDAGYIVKRAKFSLMQAKWKRAAKAVEKEFRLHLGARLHSVYVRGSVAQGTARDMVSDIDTFAVVRGRYRSTAAEKQWRRITHQKILARFPYAADVELTIISLRQVKRRIDTRVFIKTQTVCLYGSDLAPKLPMVKPGADVAMHLSGISKNITTAKLAIKKSVLDKDCRKKLCTWIMRRLVRAGSELVMKRAHVYTRDLIVGCQLFCLFYPKHRAVMKKALRLAIRPSANAKRVLPVMHAVGSVVLAEIKKGSYR